MSPHIGIVTVTYNTGTTLDTFLASIPAASTTSTTTIVAENHSPGEAEVRAIAEQHGAQFLALEDNKGYGGGTNAAVRLLAPDIELVLISNPDVVLSPGSIDTLVAAAGLHPEGASFGPRVIDSLGDTYPSARQLPSLRTGVGHALFSRLWPTNPWTRSYWSDRSALVVEREAGWVSGSCLLVRRSVFEQLGGFDSAYFMYFEDVDLGARLGKAGWKNFYIPEAVVTHSGGHSTVQSNKAMERVHHQSAYLFLSRKYAAWYLLPLRFILRLGLRSRALWVTRKH